MTRNILLLTGTISPPVNALDLARTNPQARLQDYLNAFEYHLDHLQKGEVDHIIFAENSASDLSAIAALAHRRNFSHKVELISFSGLDYPPEYGRAYGEARIIDHVMAFSPVLASAREEHAFIWKVTGRYTIRNLGDIIRYRPPRADFYCNMRNYPQRWVDMYLLGWTSKGYEIFLKDVAGAIRAGAPGTGTSPEKLLRDWLEKCPPSGAVLVPRFRHTPIIDGIRGYDNRSYAEANRWKNLLRRIALRIAPSLWI